MAEDASRRTLHHLNNLFQVILGSLEVLKRNREVSVETVDTAIRATREASLLAQQLLASRKHPAQEAPRAEPGETVLLVADDGEARRSAASALEALGYRVLSVELEKPYEPERLASAVRSAIDAASSTAPPSDSGLPKK